MKMKRMRMKRVRMNASNDKNRDLQRCTQLNSEAVAVRCIPWFGATFIFIIYDIETISLNCFVFLHNLQDKRWQLSPARLQSAGCKLLIFLKFRIHGKSRFFIGPRSKQRPKKSEPSGWQLSTRKNFPDEVRKSFLRQKKSIKRFCDKKSA